MQNDLVVPRTGLEPARLSTLAPETSASTIPPPGHCPWAENEARTRDPNLGKVVLYQLSYFRIGCYASFLQTKIKISKRAENEARTRDPNLGKVVLYQLSYFRVFGNFLFSIAFPCQGWKPYLYCGKVVLYQLSYFRVCESLLCCAFRLTGAKV